MDHKKSSQLHLPAADLVDTPYGHVCRSMEINCIRCGSTAVITVPDDKIKGIDDELLTGTIYIEHYAQEAGWIMQMIKRTGVVPALYMLCPECVKKDFKNKAEGVIAEH